MARIAGSRWLGPQGQSEILDEAKAADPNWKPASGWYQDPMWVDPQDELKERYAQTYRQGQTVNGYETADAAYKAYQGQQSPSMQALDPQSYEAIEARRREGEALGRAGTAKRREDTLRSQYWTRQDKLRSEDWARKDELFGRASSLFGSYASTSPTVSRTSGASFTQEQAARDAAFARAKEKAGQTARASMSTLQDVVAERGLMGSSVEAANTGALVGGAAGNIGEFLRDQAIQESGAATKRADMEYQGGIMQRGQDMARQQSRQQAILSLLTSGGLY